MRCFRTSALVLVGSIIALAGCGSARSESYRWSAGPQASDKDGCFEVNVRSFSVEDDRITARILLRNLTQRDAVFPCAGDAAGIAVVASGDRSPGSVKLETFSDLSDTSFDMTDDVPVKDRLVVQGHTSEIIDVEFPLKKRLASPSEPWRLALDGAWRFGDALKLDVAIAGSGRATSAMTAVAQR